MSDYRTVEWGSPDASDWVDMDEVTHEAVERDGSWYVLRRWRAECGERREVLIPRTGKEDAERFVGAITRAIDEDRCCGPHP